MATQHDDQISALNLARAEVARLRTDRLGHQQDCYHGIQDLELAIGRLDHQLSIAKTRRQTSEELGKSLSAAWLDADMPESIRDQLDERRAEIEKTSEKISGLEARRSDLVEALEDKKAENKIAVEQLEQTEAELKQVDGKISEFRGF